MPRQLFTHFLPSLFEPSDLRGGIAVVIDVLRASTTICHALDARATAIVPCETVDQAHESTVNLGRENVVLGGERHGQLIDGFDLDNSPFAYTPETVGGKTVIFTTTNGTRALSRCEKAERVLIGTFNNLSAIIKELTATTQPVHLVCAGTNNHITQEDVLFAGAVASKPELADCDIADDTTNLAAGFYLLSCASQNASVDDLRQAMSDSRGGQNLKALGMDRDIVRAAEIDRFDFVPVYEKVSNRILHTS